MANDKKLNYPNGVVYAAIWYITMVNHVLILNYSSCIMCMCLTVMYSTQGQHVISF